MQRLVNCKRSGSYLTYGVCDRGRESIAVHAYVNNQPQKKPARKKKPAIPKVYILFSDLCGFIMKSKSFLNKHFPASGFSLSPRRLSKCVFSFLQTLIFSCEMI